MIWNPSRHILVESVKQQNTAMDPYMQSVVDTYQTSEQLEEFARSWSLEAEPYVQERIFQLKCQELFDIIDQDVMIPSPESMEGENTLQTTSASTGNYPLSSDAVRSSDMTLPSTPKYFRPWETENPGMSSQLPGPSGLQQTGRGTGNDQNQPYTYGMTRQRAFAKNKAIDITYNVKFNDQWQGDKLKDLNRELHQMFDDILNNVRGSATDLGRILIHHNGLQNPIVVPLQPWEKLDSETVMNGITKVLNSNEELIVDDSLSVTIGSISIPSGSGGEHLPITTLFGPGNSLRRKRSIFEVISDQLCLPISIGLCYLKTCKKVNVSEWKTIIKDEPNKSILDNALKYRTCPKSFYYQMLDKKKQQKQKEMAQRLCSLTNVPIDRPLGLNDITPFENLLGVNINVLSSKLGNKFIRVIDNHDLPNLFIYLVESDNVQHYHGIASITGFFESSYFCETCMKPYSHRESHSCETTCDVCGSKDCTTKNPLSCVRCHRECRSNECFERHRSRKVTKSGTLPSECEKRYRCKICKKVQSYDNRNPEQHRCGEWKCTICEKFYIGQHWCYHRATAKDHKDKKFLFYDFETRQDERMECEEGYSAKRCGICADKTEPCSKCRRCQHCNQTLCGLYQHVVNFGIIQSTCSKCEVKEFNPDSTCHNCGNRCILCSKKDKRKNYVNPPCQDTCGRREHVFSGDDTARQFCNHIMQEHYKDAILVAHNAKAFDLYPILEVLIDRHSVRPDKIIYNGTKIMYMYIAKKLNLTFVDSLNFLPMKLADFPKAFGLEESCKGYFPHQFNRKENQEYIGPFPPPGDYGCDYMNCDDRKNFLAWHQTKLEEVFHFKTEMLKYCRSDVDILRRGCLRFRDIMMETTNGVDPFDYVTIAGACMGIFKTLFLKEECETEIRDHCSNQTTWLPERCTDGDRQVLTTSGWKSLSKLDKHLTPGRRRFLKSPIAMVPPDGYSIRDNYSKSSIQWLEWLMNQSGVLIKHALNGGEFRIPGTNYRADGYDESTKTIYEFHGCVYHGCLKCFPHDRSITTHPTTNQSMQELYVVTKKRESEIKSLGYKYVVIWDHEYQSQLKSDKAMKSFVERLDIQDRLNPRDSFFGGRTNAIRLHHKIQHENETIQYYDFTSLYPWTNKYCRYPVGHPTIISDDFQDISTYFGIAKVKIVPPRRLFHPVLPYASNGKLKFPLCRKCADNEHQDPCQCNQEERSIVGTWCTPELTKAVEKGYKILKVYEIYHFEESTMYDKSTGNGGLFAPYVNTFLKIKQEASGWPEDCDTEEKKQKYIMQYKEREGIELDYSKIKKNPGLRSFAKLCLNSFWGKFGQRLGMKQSRFLHESEADVFFQLLSDPKKNVHDFHIISPEILQFEWSDDPLFLSMDTKTNIFIASFTTMWARLHLYSVIETVGEDCLYMDTDSVIFVDRHGTHVKNLPVGNYLGELTNEISSDQKHITEYVSGGPKNYAYRTADGSEVCKVRGFTLNYTNSRLVNFDAVKDLLVKNQNDSITITNPSKISRDCRKRKLYNRKEDKEYRIVYTKRVVNSNLWTYPYGY